MLIVSRQHLYRVHRRSLLHCARCFEVFKSKSLLDQHSRQDTVCSNQACPFEEKFTEPQYEEIHKKRPSIPAEAQWFTIYGILFPDSELPASPCMLPSLHCV